MVNHLFAYDSQVGELLRLIEPSLKEMTTGFVKRFYQRISQQEKAAIILQRLTSEEFSSLQKAQAKHLLFLLSPDLKFEEHLKKTQRMGHAHEMVGVDLPTLLESYHLYQQEIEALVAFFSLQHEQQTYLYQAIQKRLMIDMEEQIKIHYQVDFDAGLFLENFDREIRKAGNLPDFLDSAMKNLLKLDGVVAGLFLRPDAQGDLQIEATSGQRGYQYAEYMYTGRIPFLQINENELGGQGPAGLAWRTGEIQTSVAYPLSNALRAWTLVGEKLGFRSNVAIPLLDDNDRPFAILSMYSSWPGFFETPTRQILLRHIQQALSHVFSLCEKGKVLTVEERQYYCELLEKDQIEFYYQPIIELETGDLISVEALARLRAPNGDIISPGLFLPALGKSDLLVLFKQGLFQVSQAVSSWKKLGIDIRVNLNLPAEGLYDPTYREILFKALENEELSPQNLQLEILESQGLGDLSKRDECLSAFRQAGLKIAQDDLGSGYSSLLRMDSIQFDAVKIDQGLVRGAVKDPQKALEFVYHLTRLVQGLGLPVTVEGLESYGLIEAAAILGAHYGQGYGIAKPMRAHELLGWIREFQYFVDFQNPSTPLGALAGYLLWDQQLSTLTHWPDLIEDFVRTPCLVQRYIDHSAENFRLQSMLDSNHACALRGSLSSMYQRTKRALINQLAHDWISSL